MEASLRNPQTSGSLALQRLAPQRPLPRLRGREQTEAAALLSLNLEQGA